MEKGFLEMQPEEMAQILRQGIREGLLRPGQPLVQEDLAKRFNVSRIPVREALRMLASDGLIISRPGGGTAVKALSVVEVEELYDLRISIEPTLASAIVESARPADLKRWSDWVRDLDNETGQAWVKTNYKLHIDMYAVAERPHTYRIIASILDFTQQYSNLYMATSKRYSAANEEHRAMLLAIESRDVKRLAQLIREHLRTARTELVRLLQARPAEDVLTALRDMPS